MEEPYSNCHNLSLSITTAAASPSPNTTATTPRDYDVTVILAAMICALVCALGLNSMLQCIFRCTRRTLAEPAIWVASRRLNCGLRREVATALPVSTYSSSSNANPTAAPPGCPICLTDFSDGDKIRVLPACSHRFHIGCIDTWLLSHHSCPTCRHRLSASSEAKIRGCNGPLEIVTAA